MEKRNWSDQTANCRKNVEVVPESEQSTSEYEFCGKHLIASYLDCDSDRVLDEDSLDEAMKMAIQASGATILKASTHVFPGAGLTSVYVLAESHASIHTYPEHSSCFADIFTCGTTCDPIKFDQVLVEYFKPKKISRKLLWRGEHNSVDFKEEEVRFELKEEPAPVA